MTTVWIRLDVSGDDAEEYSHESIDRVLDHGTLQDAIDSYARSIGCDLKVTSATVDDPPDDMARHEEVAVQSGRLPPKRQR